MADGQLLSPAEITGEALRIGTAKAALVWWKQLLLAFLGGAFIAFASEASNMAAFNLFARPETYGLGKCLAGAIFPVGLILVVIAGAELFTGNTLLGMAVITRRITLCSLVRNWFWVYVGNFAGALCIAYMMYASGLLSSGGNMLGGVTLRIAVYKVSLAFMPAFYLGIMCNWLVCLAVWMAWGAKSMIGKLFAIYFPIWLFITSGFEHCIANMYYIPVALFTQDIPAIVQASGLSAEALKSLTWSGFVFNNLLPVTLGNIVGGLVFVGFVYLLAYGKHTASADTTQQSSRSVQ